MLDYDEIPSEEVGRLVWVEQRIRVLVPRGVSLRGPLDLDIYAVTYDVMSDAQMGKPYRCKCGQAGIDTTGHPWGKDHYKRDRYCPHCDGAEDV